MTETIEIEVSDEFVAAEVAYGILGRAGDIHNNPDDEYEDVAIELRDVGQELLEEYE
jgi:hypothetical protein